MQSANRCSNLDLEFLSDISRLNLDWPVVNGGGNLRYQGITNEYSQATGSFLTYLICIPDLKQPFVLLSTCMLLCNTMQPSSWFLSQYVVQFQFSVSHLIITRVSMPVIL